MDSMSRSACLAAALLLAGCAASATPRYAGVEPEVRRTEAVKTIRIMSVPAGCIVELNGEYIGQTPFTLTVDADANGCWPRCYANGSARTHSSLFVCTAPNGYSDSRHWIVGDRIPDVLLFRPLGRFPAQQSLRMGLNQ